MDKKNKQNGFQISEHKNIVYNLLIFGVGCVASTTCVGKTPNFNCGDAVTQSCTSNTISTLISTCFTIRANNIIIDCPGYIITGDTTGDGTNADGKNNIKIKNLVEIFYFLY